MWLAWQIQVFCSFSWLPIHWLHWHSALLSVYFSPEQIWLQHLLELSTLWHTCLIPSVWDGRNSWPQLTNLLLWVPWIKKKRKEHRKEYFKSSQHFFTFRPPTSFSIVLSIIEFSQILPCCDNILKYIYRYFTLLWANTLETRVCCWQLSPNILVIKVLPSPSIHLDLYTPPTFSVRRYMSLLHFPHPRS